MTIIFLYRQSSQNTFLSSTRKTVPSVRTHERVSMQVANRNVPCHNVRIKLSRMKPRLATHQSLITALVLAHPCVRKDPDKNMHLSARFHSTNNTPNQQHTHLKTGERLALREFSPNNQIIQVHDFTRFSIGPQSHGTVLYPTFYC